MRSWFGLAANIVFGGLLLIPASRLHHGPIAPARQHDNSTRLGALTLMLGLLGLAISAKPLLRSGAKQPEAPKGW